MTGSQTTVPKHGGLDAALRRARELEAAHFEAVLSVRDAELLRLESLKADLAPIIAGHDRARDYFDLVLVPGEPPRLWIDLLGSVIMAPEPKTYCLAQDLPTGREVLFKTQSRAEMVEKIKSYMAHRLVARERDIAGAKPARDVRPGYSGRSVFLAWLAGVCAGTLTLLLLLIYLKKLTF